MTGLSVDTALFFLSLFMLYQQAKEAQEKGCTEEFS